VETRLLCRCLLYWQHNHRFMHFYLKQRYVLSLYCHMFFLTSGNKMQNETKGWGNRSYGDEDRAVVSNRSQLVIWTFSSLKHLCKKCMWCAWREKYSLYIVLDCCLFHVQARVNSVLMQLEMNAIFVEYCNWQYDMYLYVCQVLHHVSFCDEFWAMYSIELFIKVQRSKSKCST